MAQLQSLLKTAEQKNAHSSQTVEALKSRIPGMFSAFEQKMVEERQEMQLKLSDQSQKIHSLRNLLEIHKSTNDQSCVKLLQSNKQLLAENASLKEKLQEAQGTLSLQIQSNSSIDSLKEQLREKLQELEWLADRNEVLGKESNKVKAELKEMKDYNETLVAEVKGLKESNKDKDMDLRMIKSDCAAALMSKEKILQSKVSELESQVADLEFEKQKHIQSLHHKEQKLKQDLDDMVAGHEE